MTFSRSFLSNFLVITLLAWSCSCGITSIKRSNGCTGSYFISKPYPMCVKTCPPVISIPSGSICKFCPTPQIANAAVVGTSAIGTICVCPTATDTYYTNIQKCHAPNQITITSAGVATTYSFSPVLTITVPQTSFTPG